MWTSILKNCDLSFLIVLGANIDSGENYADGGGGPVVPVTRQVPRLPTQSYSQSQAYGQAVPSVGAVYQQGGVVHQPLVHEHAEFIQQAPPPIVPRVVHEHAASGVIHHGHKGVRQIGHHVPVVQPTPYQPTPFPSFTSTNFTQSSSSQKAGVLEKDLSKFVPVLEFGAFDKTHHEALLGLLIASSLPFSPKVNAITTKSKTIVGR